MARTSWRNRYEVWCQAEGRDRDEREYAARCRECPEPQGRSAVVGPTTWLVHMAGSRAEAWEECKRHEAMVHAGAAPTEPGGTPAPTEGR